MKYIYLDNASTTRVDQQVMKAMLPYFCEEYGNVSSLHHFGQKPAEAVDKARKTVADFFGCLPNEIIFTGSASESTNFAFKGVAEANKNQGKHLLVSPIEHSSVVDTAQHLANLGCQITWLKVDKQGLIDKQFLADNVRQDTILVTIGHSNNEIGTVQPIPELVKIVKQKNPRILFHTDATQSVQYYDLDVGKLGVDLLTITGHKFYAPKGIGALFVRQGIHLEKLIDGGQQEFGKRSGTENVPYIVGMAKAIELVKKHQKEVTDRVIRLKDKFIKGVITEIKDVELSGYSESRLPHIANFLFKNVEGESILMMLDEKGIAVSTGSACASHSLKPSHVLTGVGCPAEKAHGSIRFSFGKNNTEEEIDYVLEVLPKIIAKLRKISPLK